MRIGLLLAIVLLTGCAYSRTTVYMPGESPKVVASSNVKEAAIAECTNAGGAVALVELKRRFAPDSFVLSCVFRRSFP